VLGESDGEGGEPDDGGGVGVEDLGAVEGGSVQPALGHEEEPELIVAGRRDEGEQDRHGEGGGGEDLEREESSQRAEVRVSQRWAATLMGGGSSDW
jgi:hypothetical protein